jgi:hypothetical protein
MTTRQREICGIRNASLLCLTGFGFVVISGCEYQQAELHGPDPHLWELGEASLEVGGDQVQLHRVRGGIVLPAGEVVIADAGNHQILTLSRDGEVLHAFGGPGPGPEEFMSLSALFGSGDTVIAYDAQLGRVSVWHPDGTAIGATRLPRVGGTATELRAAVSSDEYVVTTRLFDLESTGGGLKVVDGALLRFSAASGEVTDLRSNPMGLSYLYVHHQNGGITGYETPFLEQARFAVAGGKVVTNGLGGEGMLQLIPTTGGESRVLRLPVAHAPFNRERVGRHRDYLLSRSDGERFAGARARIQEVYGPEFPAPARDPIVRTLVTVGDAVWLQVFPDPGGAETRWFIVDPVAESVVGQLHLPANWMVLGGTDKEVLIHREDELGVEWVEVRGFRRP